ncbi:cytochrome P450 [Aspergillus taichungensis]|uniref:Cytochrome P450 n=1 Tax=Aspergillus taichungensis TaxID=482145 RepID=A0A2J5HZ66_9EURO|nr:cytochrome P450 [Aspergillus taichungensis]
MGLSFLVSTLVGVAVLYVLKLVLFPKRALAPLPPGPKGKPIIGNLADLPPPGQKDWEYWAGFKKLYGPISSVTILGQTIIMVNDRQMSIDLMEKRSSIHSSRPRMTFAGELVGWNNAVAMQEYSDRFRAYRKAIHKAFGTKPLAARFNSLQDVEVRRFLLRVLDKPHDLIQHLRTEAGAVILKIAYGYNIEPHGSDPLVMLVNDAMEDFSLAAAPGKWIVDTVPFLKHLPAWLPGMGFKKIASAWRKTLIETIEKPYIFVRQQMRQGSYPPSYLASLVEEGAHKWTPDDELLAKWSAGSLYTGGADTTVSSLSCFFLAMALNPDVQRKAQEEIDRVIGPNKLPSFADRENLPYIDAVVKEVLRWHPVGPIGLPHMTTEDDIYEGYRIPKGSIILPNIWEMFHDPSAYANPEAFNPDRFLATDTHTPELDPHSIAFGFGRRICPGRLLADNTVFLSIAQSLAVFNIATTEEIGKPDFTTGVVSHPAPYKYEITPRSEAHEALIRAVEVEAPWEESHAAEINGIDFKA